MSHWVSALPGSSARARPTCRPCARPQCRLALPRHRAARGAARRLGLRAGRRTCAPVGSAVAASPLLPRHRGEPARRPRRELAVARRSARARRESSTAHGRPRPLSSLESPRGPVRDGRPGGGAANGAAAEMKNRDPPADFRRAAAVDCCRRPPRRRNLCLGAAGPLYPYAVQPRTSSLTRSRWRPAGT